MVKSGTDNTVFYTFPYSIGIGLAKELVQGFHNLEKPE